MAVQACLRPKASAPALSLSSRGPVNDEGLDNMYSMSPIDLVPLKIQSSHVKSQIVKYNVKSFLISRARRNSNVTGAIKLMVQSSCTRIILQRNSTSSISQFSRKDLTGASFTFLTLLVLRRLFPSYIWLPNRWVVGVTLISDLL